MRIGIITGLEMEADIVRKAVSAVGGFGRPLVVHGYGPENAGRVARQFAGQSATALLSFGFAGAIDPGLQTGDLIIAARVSDRENREFKCDGDWRSRSAQLLASFDPCSGGILTTVGVVTDAAYKSELFAGTGALAVDMESVAIAGVAEEFGLPFLAIRVVLDDALSELPPAALAGIDESGATTPDRAAAALLRRPQDMAAVTRLALASRKAKKVLGRVAGAGLPFFGLG